MRLCMFHPLDHPMERGWVGRIEDEHVIHLAAQTLQSYFTGGGAAREHAVYPLAGVRLLAPVLHPPAIRVFDAADAFEFANPAAICNPDARVATPWNDRVRRPLELLARVAGVVGAREELAGFTLFAEWRDPQRRPPKDRDFALGLGPVVVTLDELDATKLEAIVRVDGDARANGLLAAFDWHGARGLASEGTRLYPGDLVVGPAAATVVVQGGSDVELEVREIGVLSHRVAPNVRHAHASDR